MVGRFALESMTGCPYDNSCSIYRNYYGLNFMYYCFLADLTTNSQATAAMQHCIEKSLVLYDLTPVEDDDYIVSSIRSYIHGTSASSHIVTASNVEKTNSKIEFNSGGVSYRITLDNGLQYRAGGLVLKYWVDV